MCLIDLMIIDNSNLDLSETIEINDDTKLSDLSYDSFCLFGLICDIESKFNMHITKYSAEKWLTVRDVKNSVGKKQALIAQ